MLSAMPPRLGIVDDLQDTRLIGKVKQQQVGNSEQQPAQRERHQRALGGAQSQALDGPRRIHNDTERSQCRVVVDAGRVSQQERSQKQQSQGPVRQARGLEREQTREPDGAQMIFSGRIPNISTPVRPNTATDIHRP